MSNADAGRVVRQQVVTGVAATWTSVLTLNPSTFEVGPGTNRAITFEIHHQTSNTAYADCTFVRAFGMTSGDAGSYLLESTAEIRAGGDRLMRIVLDTGIFYIQVKEAVKHYIYLEMWVSKL